MASLSGWKIASVRGVELRIHVSLLFLLTYVILIAALQFPYVAARSGVPPTAISGGPYVWAFLFALGLFASVALHEFAHAFAAQSMGVHVRGITLMMLGGVSEMEQIPEKRLSEFRMAMIGPITSLALAAVMLFSRPYLGNPELSFYFYWLGRANLVLGIFNLLPAFPLDGGRALRSLLASRMGMLRATAVSVQIGKAFAWFLGIMGILSFNLLLLLIAFFLYGAAQSEYSFTLTRRILRGLTAREALIATSPVSETHSLAQAADQMINEKRSLLPVLMSDNRYGLVSLADLQKIPRQDWSAVTVRELAVLSNRTLDLEEPLSEIIPELIGSPYGALPVKAGGQIVGFVRYADLAEIAALRSLSGEEEEEPGHRAA